MTPSKIIIYRSSPYVVETGMPADNRQTVVSFDELKQWLKSGKIWGHLFRYDEAVMVTADLRLIAKPFVTTLLLWLLARKRTVMRDDRGAVQEVGIGVLLSLFRKFMKDFRGKERFFKDLELQVKSLCWEGKIGANPRPDLSFPPVYLRTDMVFGLKSGGSVGHIAGVLNQLDQFTGKPIFLTTDRIPTVRTDLETHQVLPGDQFWDFSEMPAFHYNHVFYVEALRLLGERKISFIYQRYSLNNFSGLQLARHYRVPFLLEYNGSEIWVGRNWGSVLKYEAMSQKIEDLNLGECDMAVVVSQPLKDEMVKRGVSAEKILVNPNGVDTELYSPKVDGSIVRQKYGLEGKTVLGFIGTFGRWHGAEVLAQAFGELMREFPELRTKARLLMVGDGITMPLVKETLEKYGVLNFCVLTGTLPQAEGPAHLAACDILAAPTVPNPDGTPFFGSPTKLFEYMAMGKGIVASDLDQIGEILKHNETAWLVKPGDKDSLKEGLKALMGDKALREKLGRAAREECVAKYTWKEHTRKIIEKLKERCG